MANTNSGQSVYPVILSGGAGTRLWPVSRPQFPKQLHGLTGERSLLQKTALRHQTPWFKRPVIICNAGHRFIVAEQLQVLGITPTELMLEPVGRDTAPAIAAAVLRISQLDEGAIVLVVPSDHLIEDLSAYHKAILAGIPVARSGVIVTFGVTPDRPETGYGYIRRGAQMPGAENCFAVEDFVEKPDRERAQKFVESGTYYWNSGIFLFSASHFLAALENHETEIVSLAKLAVQRATRDLDFLRLDPESFGSMRSVSIDHALIERTSKLAVVPAEFDWTDIGSWAAAWGAGSKDENKNVLLGDVSVHETFNSYVRSDGPLVTTVGIEDIAVVATQDAILVARLDKSQQVKQVVAELSKLERDEVTSHPRTLRPWGEFQNIDGGDGYAVKRIIVKPGQKLSLQRHQYRAEHWVVVRGSAVVQINESVQELATNESVYIPAGAIHRLENNGDQ
ncbi:MAG TPA: mannose-1-phosphate guanylyltransferase/mannose-6-phosphate isomerase, partial [Sneathiellales bacterium]|nr:mannose-1-phosphate guanylyltransferase/mannose-6-phosphate isomerase [Sneathiellales bacterium]